MEYIYPRKYSAVKNSFSWYSKEFCVNKILELRNNAAKYGFRKLV
jgi:hypothetical protein